MGTPAFGTTGKKRLSAEQRQEVLLKVAGEVFLEKGYEATSLDDIIGRSGGSRRNIYTQFGGKEGLFKALITEIAGQALASVQQEFDKEGSLRENLRRFADRLLSTLLRPSALNLSMLALADGVRFPELAKVYFEAGPQRAAESLAELFDYATKRGEITCRDNYMAASQFIGMLRDNLYLQVLLRLRPAPEQRERQEIIASAVDIFLYGISRQ